MRAIPVFVAALAAVAANGSSAPPQVEKWSPEGPHIVLCDPCVVHVVLKDVKGKCVAASPGPEHRVGHVKLGKLVQWIVQNDCSKPMSVGVNGFKPKYKGRDKPNELDLNPLDSKCADSLKTVAAKSKGTYECPVREKAWSPRTYLYNIVSSEGVLVDPEMEIVP